MTTHEERKRQEMARRATDLKSRLVPPVATHDAPLGDAEQRAGVKDLDEALEEAMWALHEARGALRVEEMQPAPPPVQAEGAREVAQHVEQAIALLRRLRAAVSQ